MLGLSGSRRFVVSSFLAARVACPRGTFHRAWKVDGGVKQTMMGSRLRVWATMILFSLPFLFLAISVHLFALGE